MITRKGKELADALNPIIGSTDEIYMLCSKICRLAKTHHRLAEIACNRELTDFENKQDDAVEARITDLVAMLPEPDNSKWEIEFQGDPRGSTVKLRAQGYERYYNNWALDCIYVPT